MIYTKTNRYSIPNQDLEKYHAQIKASVIKLEIDNKEYYTDGHMYFNPIELSQMLNGSLFPFPETVCLSNKQKFNPGDSDIHKKEIEDILKKPIIGTGIYE
jgi:hypothetical protein